MTNANGTHRNICRDDRLVSDYIALSSNIANHLFFESDKLNVFTAIVEVLLVHFQRFFA